MLHVQDNVGFGRVTLNLGLRFEHSAGLLPEQGAPGGPFSSQRSFPRRGRLFWNTLRSADWSGLRSAPDAQGRGQSGGTHVAAMAQAVSHRPTEQSRWDYLRAGRPERRRVFQPGEEGTQLFSFGGSITSVDSDLKQPYRRVHGGRGVRSARNIRVSGIYSIGRRVTCSQSRSWHSLRYRFLAVPAIDPVTGQTVTLFNQLPETLGNNRQLLTNPPNSRPSSTGSKYPRRGDSPTAISSSPHAPTPRVTSPA